MKTSRPEAAPLAAAATALALAPTAAADTVQDLIARIRSADDNVRGPAWQNAAVAGAEAVQPLAKLMADAHFEVARAAQRALAKIVRHVGRPGASSQRHAVQSALVAALRESSGMPRRHLLWLLSEIGDDDAVNAMAVLLNDAEACEDARCALMRIPGRRATAALRSAFQRAPEDFKFALAESLRSRGEKVAGYPSRKLVPTKATSVKPKAA